MSDGTDLVFELHSASAAASLAGSAGLFPLLVDDMATKASRRELRPEREERASRLRSEPFEDASPELDDEQRSLRV